MGEGARRAGSATLTSLQWVEGRRGQGRGPPGHLPGGALGHNCVPGDGGVGEQGGVAGHRHRRSQLGLALLARVGSGHLIGTPGGVGGGDLYCGKVGGREGGRGREENASCW